jgi:large subunit ribosomal protein L18
MLKATVQGLQSLRRPADVAEMRGLTIAQASEVGKRLAEAAKQAGVETVVFDRGGYLFHGRVKALADGAREGGLRF